MQFRIETPAEFFQHIVTTDVQEFLQSEPSLRTAYHACTSLLSSRDWVLAMHKERRWSRGGTAKGLLSGANKFQEELASIDLRFDIVADIANASKHMILDANRSRTALYGNADTVVSEGAATFGGTPFGEVPFGGSVGSIHVKINDQFYEVRSCVHAVYEVWQALNAENSW